MEGSTALPVAHQLRSIVPKFRYDLSYLIKRRLSTNMRPSTSPCSSAIVVYIRRGRRGYQADHLLLGRTRRQDSYSIRNRAAGHQNVAKIGHPHGIHQIYCDNCWFVQMNKQELIIFAFLFRQDCYILKIVKSLCKLFVMKVSL